MELTEDERHIILHSLGVEYRRGRKKLRAYRSHYCANADDTRLPALVAKGAMKAGIEINGGRQRYYHVTSAGARAVGHKLPKDD